MNEALPLLSIIIPVYQASQETFTLIFTLCSQVTNIPYEIIVADDASPDGSAERLQRQFGACREFRLVRLKHNCGPAAARNAAIAAARGELLLLLDADCLSTDNGLVETALRIGRKYPHAVIGGGVSGFGRGMAAFCDRYCHWATNLPDRSAFRLVAGHVVTANMIFDRTVWERLGPFAGSLRTGEDTAWCLAAHRAGIPVWFDPALTVRHHDRETWSAFVDCLFRVGRDRAGSRRIALGYIPWYLAGPAWRRWLLLLPMAVALLVRLLAAWWRYDWRVWLALPGMSVGMMALAVGVAIGPAAGADEPISG